MYKLKKVLSVFLIFTFVISNCSQYSYGADTIAYSSDSDFFINNLQIPEYLGEIKYRNIGSGDKIVFHIQDAHCNYYAQKSIFRIIKILNGRYGIKMINVEGGQDEYDLSVFNRISNEQVRREVSDYFVKTGEINGSEFFTINNMERAQLWGIEDGDIYLKNIEVYKDSLRYKEDAEKRLKELSSVLEGFKPKCLNRKLFEFDKKRTDYRNQDIEFKEYFKFLFKKRDDLSLSKAEYSNLGYVENAIELEKDIDFKQAEKERKKLIEQFENRFSKNEMNRLIFHITAFKNKRISAVSFYKYLLVKSGHYSIDLRKLYPELNKFITYQFEFFRNDLQVCMEDVEQLEAIIQEKLFESKEEREFLLVVDRLNYLKKLFSLSLLKKDYKYYKENRDKFAMQEFISYIRALSADSGEIITLTPGILRLNRYQKEIFSFYEYSFLRDDAFLENIQYKQFKRPRTNLEGKAAIVVTGGFHTENLLSLFKEKGVSYVSIIPKFDSPEGYVSPYFDVLAGKSSPFRNSLEEAMFMMQVPSPLTKLGIRIDPTGGELFRVQALALAYTKELGKSFAVKTTGANEYVLFQNTEKGPQSTLEVISKERILNDKIIVVNENLPVERDDPIQFLWAFAQVGHDLVVRDRNNHLYVTGNENSLVKTVKEYIDNIPDTNQKFKQIKENLLSELDYLISTKRIVRNNVEKPSMISIVAGLKGGRAGGQGIYLPKTDDAGRSFTERELAGILMHEIIAGIYVKAGHKRVKELEELMVSGGEDLEIKLRKLSKFYSTPIWRIGTDQQAAEYRRSLARDYAADEDLDDIFAKLTAWAGGDKYKKEGKKKKKKTPKRPLKGLSGGWKQIRKDLKKNKPGEKIKHPAYRYRYHINSEGYDPEIWMRIIADARLAEILGIKDKVTPRVEEGQTITMSKPNPVEIDDEGLKEARARLVCYRNLLENNFSALELIDKKLTPEMLKSIIEAVEKMVENYTALTKGLSEDTYHASRMEKRFKEFKSLVDKGYTEADLARPEIRSMITDITNPGSVHKFINELHELSSEPLFWLTELAGASYTLTVFTNHILVADLSTKKAIEDGEVVSELLSFYLSALDEEKSTNTKARVIISDDLMLVSVQLGEHRLEMVSHLADPDDGGQIILKYKDVDVTRDKKGRRVDFIRRVLEGYGFYTKLEKEGLLKVRLDKDHRLSSIHEIRNKLPQLLRLLYNITNMDVNIVDGNMYDDDPVATAVHIYQENLKLLHTKMIHQGDLPPKIKITGEIRRNLNKYLVSLNLQRIPSFVNNITQKIINKYINEPIERRIDRGEIIRKDDDTIELNSDNYRPLDSILEDLLDGKDLSCERIQMAEILNTAANKIDFENTGIVGSLLVQVGSFRVGSKVEFTAVVLRDPVKNNIVFAKIFRQEKDGTFQNPGLDDVSKLLTSRGLKVPELENISTQEMEGCLRKLYEDWPAVEVGNSQVLQGITASPGRTEVHTITFNKNSVAEGNQNILFVPFTTPEDTVLFAKLPAVVTIGGGVLSHSAITAREYGIPSVILNTARAVKNETDGEPVAWEVMTSTPEKIINRGNMQVSYGIRQIPVLIQEGTKVIVDGDNGTISIIRDNRAVGEFVPRKTFVLDEGGKKQTVKKNFSKVEVVSPGKGERGAYPLKGEMELDVAYVGGKGYNLREIAKHADKFDYNVPDGVLLTRKAFSDFVKAAGISSKIEQILLSVRFSLKEKEEKILDLFIGANQEARDTVKDYLGEFIDFEDEDNEVQKKWWAVRSSNVEEDRRDTSFAGLGETDLYVSTDELVDKVIYNFSTFATERALQYRLSHGMYKLTIAHPVVVQEMVASEVSGVLFTADPTRTDGSRDTIIINVSDGLGEAVVSSLVDPDVHIVSKKSGYEVEKYKQGTKRVKIIQKPSGGTETVMNEIETRSHRRLSRKNILKISEIAREVELIYGFPVDMEFAFIGDKVYVLQVRPVTRAVKEDPLIPAVEDFNHLFIEYLTLVNDLDADFVPSGSNIVSVEQDMSKALLQVMEVFEKLLSLMAYPEAIEFDGFVKKAFPEKTANERLEIYYEIIKIISSSTGLSDVEIIGRIESFITDAIPVFGSPGLIGKINGNVPAKILLEDKRDEGFVLINGIKVLKKEGISKAETGGSIYASVLEVLGIKDLSEDELNKINALNAVEKTMLKKFVGLLRDSSIVFLENRVDVKGAIDPGTKTIYLSEKLAAEPLAILHELGEGFASKLLKGIFAQYPELSAHTYMRGLGNKARRALKALLEEGDGVNIFEVPYLINEKMMSMNLGRGLTSSEIALINYNTKQGLKGIDLTYGFQDKLNKQANAALTERVNQMNEKAVQSLVSDIRRGFMDIIICPAMFEMKSSQMSIEKDCVRRFSKKYGTETLIENYDFVLDPEERIDEILKIASRVQEQYSLTGKNEDKKYRIAVYLTKEDKLLLDRRLSSDPDLIPEIDRISFLIDDIPTDCLYSESKLIVTAKSLLNYARVRMDFGLGVESQIVKDIQNRLISGLGVISGIKNLEEELRTPEDIDKYLMDILKGINLLKITRIDYETIKDWAESQQQISQSL